jgi:endonuclease-3
LAGVGHKTASVVMSQAFGFPAFPVDTHIHRLMKQWKLTEGKNVVQTENDAKKLFPKETWNKLHLQIIFYGREYSPAEEIRRKIILRKCFLRNNQIFRVPLLEGCQKSKILTGC